MLSIWSNTTSRNQSWLGVSCPPLPDPGGVSEISRWWSVSDTTGLARPEETRLPAGLPDRMRDAISLAPRWGAVTRGDRFRWCRCAQPPANIWHPFGMKTRPIVRGGTVRSGKLFRTRC